MDNVSKQIREEVIKNLSPSEKFNINEKESKELLVLKQNRKDKSPTDYADIAFLQSLIKQD